MNSKKALKGIGLVIALGTVAVVACNKYNKRKMDYMNHPFGSNPCFGAGSNFGGNTCFGSTPGFGTPYNSFGDYRRYYDKPFGGMGRFNSFGTDGGFNWRNQFNGEHSCVDPNQDDDVNEKKSILDEE